jgi:hypothetical protein
VTIVRDASATPRASATRRANRFESLRPWAKFWATVLIYAAISHDAAAERVCPNVGFTLVEPSASPETRPVKLGRQTLFVRRDAITTTSEIADIKLAGDDYDALILIKFEPAAADRLLAATTDHDGQKMAFVVDDEVLLAVTWTGPYGIGPEGAQLSILHGKARAQKLIESLKGCIGGVRTP